MLKTFLEVERTRHFGRAAESLCLTPAAVSARVRLLEGILGSPLFLRKRSQMLLTPAGEKLKPRAEEVLAALARAIEDSTSRGSGPRLLSVGGGQNLWDFYLRDGLAELHRRHPDVALKAECHDSGYLTSLLQTRQLDAAFLLDPIMLEQVECEPCASLNLQLMAAQPGLKATDVRREQLALVEWSAGFGVEVARRHPGGAPPALRTSAGRIALQFIRNTGLVGYFPAGEQRTGELYSVEGADDIELPVYLLRQRSSRKQQLIDELTQILSPAASPGPVTG